MGKNWYKGGNISALASITSVTHGLMDICGGKECKDKVVREGISGFSWTRSTSVCFARDNDTVTALLDRGTFSLAVGVVARSSTLVAFDRMSLLSKHIKIFWTAVLFANVSNSLPYPTGPGWMASMLNRPGVERARRSPGLPHFRLAICDPAGVAGTEFCGERIVSAVL